MGYRVAVAMLVAGAAATTPLSATTLQTESLEDRWVEVGSDDESVYHLDTRTVERTGDLRRVWRRTRFHQPLPDGAVVVMDQLEWDCAFRMYAPIAYARLRADGTTIVSGNIHPRRREAEGIVPGTSSEREYEILCR